MFGIWVSIIVSLASFLGVYLFFFALFLVHGNSHWFHSYGGHICDISEIVLVLGGRHEVKQAVKRDGQTRNWDILPIKINMYFLCIIDC